MKKVIYALILSVLFGCASVSDSVVTAIDQEQYEQLNYIYILIQDYQFYANNDSLDMAIKELESIDLDKVYNNDFKAKVLGLKSLTLIYKDDRSGSRALLKDLEKISTDEELFWIVTALLEKDKTARLEILKEGKEKVYSIEKLDSFLADAYLENEMYGEATALYDTILLTEEYFKNEFQDKRDISYLFLHNPPSSYESGRIITKDNILTGDLLELIEIETNYLNSFDKNNLYSSLQEKEFFYQNQLEYDDYILRKDLAYFLFALFADRNKSLNLWEKYKEFFTPDISNDEKMELKGMSPILDTPIYEYFFYPALFLIEEEVMELPDGENFYPNQAVSGRQLHSVISNLQKRLD